MSLVRQMSRCENALEQGRFFRIQAVATTRVNNIIHMDEIDG